RPGVRMREYLATIGLEWGLLAALAILWWRTQRPWSALGLIEPQGWRFLGGVVLVTAFAVMSSVQLMALVRSPKAMERLHQRLEHLSALLPHNRLEMRTFTLLSISAGITEEILYRGFMQWDLKHWMPLGLAMVVAAVIFGFAHIYQGPRNIISTGLIGLVMAI